MSAETRCSLPSALYTTVHAAPSFRTSVTCAPVTTWTPSSSRTERSVSEVSGSSLGATRPLVMKVTLLPTCLVILPVAGVDPVDHSSGTVGQEELTFLGGDAPHPVLAGNRREL